jgi:hypothetical protein
MYIVQQLFYEQSEQIGALRLAGTLTPLLTCTLTSKNSSVHLN